MVGAVHNIRQNLPPTRQTFPKTLRSLGYIYLLYPVKYYKWLMAVVCLFFGSAANAQNENWDTYLAKFGDKPGSVMIDLALIERAPDRKYPYLIITGPHAQSCDAHGFPEKYEIPNLEEILDATSNFLTGVTPKVLTGTFTHGCERLNYYYVKDTAGIRNALQRLYSRTYPNYKYTLNIKPDPDWIKYRTFLYPSPETLNWMECDRAISTMKQQGDSLKGERDITFDVYFKSDTDRQAFVAIATSKNYRIGKTIMSQSKVAPFEVIIDKRSLVRSDLMNSMTAEIKAAVKKHNGLYSGWEAKK